jgi:hypothetical protein
MERLSYDVLYRIVNLSLSNAFVISKILAARADILPAIEKHITASYEELVRKRWSGLIYPKYEIQKKLPELSLIKDICMSNNIAAMKIFEEKLRFQYKSILYNWSIESAILLSGAFGNIEILRYLLVECKHPLICSFDIWSNSPTETLDFLKNELCVEPSNDAFFKMMRNNQVDFLTYLPKSLSEKTVFLAYRLMGCCSSWETNFQIETLNVSPEDLTEEEKYLWKLYLSNSIPIWRVQKYVWENFNSYPTEYELEESIRELLSLWYENEESLKGTKFIMETLGYEPSMELLDEFLIDLGKSEELKSYILDFMNIEE